MAKEADESFVVNLGIEKGVDEIIKKHPRWKGRKKEIMQHMDWTRLQERVYDIYQNLEDKKISEEKRREYIVNELTDYVSTGMALDDEGKEVILNKGLEEMAKKGFLKGRRAKNMLIGEEYLDRGLAFAHNLSYLMESEDYQKKMPEIAEAASVLEDMQLLDPLIKILRHSDMIDERGYRFLQNRIYEKTRESMGGIKAGIEKYVASYILGFFGVFLIAYSSKITGAVIGVQGNMISSLVGVSMILISIILLSLKGKNKKNKFKK